MGKKKNNKGGKSIASPEADTQNDVSSSDVEVVSNTETVEDEVSLDNVHSPEPIQDLSVETKVVPTITTETKFVADPASPQVDPQSLLLNKLQDLHDEQLRQAEERESQLRELVHTLEQQLIEREQQSQRDSEQQTLRHQTALHELQENSRINSEKLTSELQNAHARNQELTLLLNKANQQVEESKLVQEQQSKVAIEAESLRAEVESKSLEVQALTASLSETQSRSLEALNTVRMEKNDLVRKFYHHAFLAVKLKLIDSGLSVNFDINDMVELAMTENVQEGDLNEWIGRKLNLHMTQPLDNPVTTVTSTTVTVI